MVIDITNVVQVSNSILIIMLSAIQSDPTLNPRLKKIIWLDKIQLYPSYP